MNYADAPARDRQPASCKYKLVRITIKQKIEGDGLPLIPEVRLDSSGRERPRITCDYRSSELLGKGLEKKFDVSASLQHTNTLHQPAIRISFSFPFKIVLLLQSLRDGSHARSVSLDHPK